MDYSAHYYTALQEARDHHAAHKTYSGKFLRPHALPIRTLIQAFDIESIIDWGCGKGAQYAWRSHSAEETGIPLGWTLEQFWGVTVQKYDPAYPPYAAPLRSPADMVICTHVLGSIPVDDLPLFLATLFSHARKVVYLAEKIGPVHKAVFSAPESMPRWSRERWCQALRVAAVDFPTLRVWFATRERGPEGVITQAAWL